MEDIENIEDQDQVARRKAKSSWHLLADRIEEFTELVEKEPCSPRGAEVLRLVRDTIPPDVEEDEDLFELWWSRRCPSCKKRYLVAMTQCPDCGERLRDLSTSGFWPDPSGLQITGSGILDLETLLPESGLGLEDEPELPPVLGQKWRVRHLVGEGSFGRFFLGEHCVLGRQVGIKVLRTRYISTAARPRRAFHQEAMRLSRLNHPNIVQVLDFGEETVQVDEKDRHVPYIVLEYLSGSPLSDFISNDGLSVDDSVDVVSQVAEALIYAHKGRDSGEALVHLDLKPEHIFLERIRDHWHIKVIDFGIAEIVSAPDSDGETSGAPRRRIAGTLPYMAPERWKGVVDPSCDIYSLGVVLYELVSGRTPFVADGLESLRQAIETELPRPPSQHRPAAPKESITKLDSIILGCLAKDPEDRPRSAEVLLEELKDWKTLRAEEIKRDEESSFEKSLRVLRKLFLVLIAVILPLVSLAYWGPWNRIDSIPGSVLLGEDPPESMICTTTVHGWGYQEAPVFLLVDLENDKARINFGTVGDDGSIEGPWPSRMTLERELGHSLSEGDYNFNARIVVKGWGRSLESADFLLRLDYKRPHVLDVRALGNSRARFNKDARRLLLSTADEATRLRVVATESLRTGDCQLNFQPPVSEPSNDTVDFLIEPDSEEVEFVLVDSAGNQETETWSIEWVGAPEIPVPESETLYTNQNPYLLSIELSEVPGRLEVVVDGAEPITTDAQSWTVPISFGPDTGDEITKNVVIKAWSRVSDLEGEPDVERAVKVRFLKRRLTVQRGDDVNFEAVFKFVDERGNDLDLQLKGPISVSVTHKRTGERLPASVSVGTGKMSSIHLKGKFECSFDGEDRYGNLIGGSLEFFHPAPPSIVEFRTRGTLGTYQEPLHLQGCSCREGKAWKQDSFQFDTKIGYRDTEDLVSKLYLLDDPLKPTGRMEISGLLPVKNGYSVPLAELVEKLKLGDNWLELEVTDPGAEEVLSHTFRCRIVCEELRVKIDPDHESLVAPGKLELSIVTSGAAVKSVKIGDHPARRQETDHFRGEIQVEHTRPAAVNIEVQLQNGVPHTANRTYRPVPVDGWKYTFEVGDDKEKLNLELVFHRESGEGEPFRGFWYTPPGAWKKYLGAFRRPGMEGPGDHGVSFDTAEAIRKKLQEKLAKGKWIATDQQVRFLRFPSLEQIRKLPAPAPGQERLEWLDDEAPKGYTAVLARVNPLGAQSIPAFSDLERCGFRLVILYPAPDSRLDAWEAAESEEFVK